jgi:hypothetical protein
MHTRSIHCRFGLYTIHEKLLEMIKNDKNSMFLELPDVCIEISYT